MQSGAKFFICEVACLLLLTLLLPSGVTIEVHEDVNESPIGAHLRINASTAHAAVMVNERSVNDLPPSPQHQQRQPAVLQPAADGNEGASAAAANNLTTFPGNHQQHSGPSGAEEGHGPTSSVAETESERVTSTPPPLVTGAIAGRTSVATPSTTGHSSGLSSYRATTVHSGRAATTSAIVNDRSAQHQISGYRKRQLYASAVLLRGANATRSQLHSSDDAQFAKEFVPSPEVVSFYQQDSSPMLPSGQTLATQGSGPGSAGTVDASYPTGLSAGDSKWYAGFGPSVHSYSTSSGKSLARPAADEAGKWDHKFSWSAAHRHQDRNTVQFPQDSTPLFPAPKGKWKWIPEDEVEEAPADDQLKPAATPFSSGGDSSSGSVEEQQRPFGKHYFTHPTVKNHPYSFDRLPIGDAGTPFSGDTGTSTETANSTETTGEQSQPAGGGSTDVKPVGKEDAHFKSVSPWKKIIHVLSAAIPIGLLISALTPQVVYINPNATQPPIQLQTPTPISGVGPASTGLRQRSLGQGLTVRELGTDPAALVKLFHKLTALDRDGELSSGESLEGTNRLMDASSRHRIQGCDWKLLCQLARQGMLPESDMLHKRLWKIANETPVEWTGQPGLDEVFRIIRDGDCGRLQRTCDQDTRDEQ